jgi:hypothetical protein
MTTLPPRLCKSEKRQRKLKEGKRLPSLNEFGAGDESRTRDLNLGKVALYQLSYSRKRGGILSAPLISVKFS